MGPDQVDAVEANHLYWRTEEPVARIADRLDLSRRALYDLVLPLGSGAACAACGAELGYPNRSARSHGEAVCPECGVREYVAPAAVSPDGGPEEAAEDRSLAVVRGGDRSPDAREADLRHRAAVLGGAAIACVALGTVATLLAMRRG